MILTLICALVKAILMFPLAYLLYYRVFDYIRAKLHYEGQKITWTFQGVLRSYPLICNIPVLARMTKDMKKCDSKNNLIDEMINVYADGY